MIGDDRIIENITKKFGIECIEELAYLGFDLGGNTISSLIFYAIIP